MFVPSLEWDAHTPSPASVPPPGTKGGGGGVHTRQRVRGWGSLNSADWRKKFVYSVDIRYCGLTFYLSRKSSPTLYPSPRTIAPKVSNRFRLKERQKLQCVTVLGGGGDYTFKMFKCLPVLPYRTYQIRRRKIVSKLVIKICTSWKLEQCSTVLDLVHKKFRTNRILMRREKHNCQCGDCTCPVPTSLQ